MYILITVRFCTVKFFFQFGLLGCELLCKNAMLYLVDNRDEKLICFYSEIKIICRNPKYFYNIISVNY